MGQAVCIGHEWRWLCDFDELNKVLISMMKVDADEMPVISKAV